jgi:hypothetical protein
VPRVSTRRGMAGPGETVTPTAVAKVKGVT